MKVSVDGNLNKYYVQTLCMVFFPGVKFSDDDSEDGLEIDVRIAEDEEGATADAVLRHFDQVTRATHKENFKPEFTSERTLKIAVGAAVIAAAGDLVGYRPSWGMLTGVRPSKVATEMLRKGYSKTRVKKLLASEYFVIPKKASLATEVALNEAAIIAAKDDRAYMMQADIKRAFIKVVIGFLDEDLTALSNEILAVANKCKAEYKSNK